MFFRSAVVFAILVLAAFFLLTEPSTLPGEALQARIPNLANGETMFNIGGCSSCHAEPQQHDRRKLGGGIVLRSPFGNFTVPNISPDPNHGIGSWTELQFVNAMLKGVGREGEHLYPSFPFTSYQRMALEDVRDLFAFLKTLPPAPVAAKPHQLTFPFNIRRLLGLWKLLFVDGRQFIPEQARGAVYNRGAYLVEGPGHCVECHSSRNRLGGINPSTRLAGGADPEGTGGWAPNITPHPDGLASWSVKDFEFFLETGLAPDGSGVTGKMAEVIENTSRLSEADRAAIAVFLKALPPRAGKAPPRQ